MGRTYAGILGMIAFSVTVGRGLIDRSDPASTLKIASVCLAMMAVVGAVVGRVAGAVIDDCVRNQLEAEIEGRVMGRVSMRPHVAPTRDTEPVSASGDA